MEMRSHHPSYIKHLMDETKSNFRFPLLGQVMLGITKTDPNITWPHKTNQLFDKVELRSVYYTRTYLIVSNQLQTQQPTLFLFASCFLKSLRSMRSTIELFWSLTFNSLKSVAMRFQSEFHTALLTHN